MKKLAIITTHPIQYNAPLFAMLHERGRIKIKVFYTWGEQVLKKKYDPGFRKHIEWDIPLLEGYEHTFVKNVSANPGSHHYKGVDNPTLISDIKNWRADAVLVYGWRFKSHLAVLKSFHKKIPVYFRGDSTLLDTISPVKKLFRRVFLKWVYKKVDKALFVGTHNKNYYLQFGLREDQLIFAPHAVDNQRFAITDTNKKMALTLRSELSIPDDNLVFLFAGKLENKKNPLILINAFKSVSRSDIHLVIAGNGALEKEMKWHCKEDQNIHFIDFQNQSFMPVLYLLTDVFILPSRGPGETWGLAINEAMASCRPVLVSDACGAAADLVHSGVNGFLFQSQNLMDLKEKMLYCMNNKNGLKNMGMASLKIISGWNYANDCVAIEKLLND